MRLGIFKSFLFPFADDRRLVGLLLDPCAVALVPPEEHGAGDKYRGECADCDTDHEHQREVDDDARREYVERERNQEGSRTREQRSGQGAVDGIVDYVAQRHGGLHYKLFADSVEHDDLVVYGIAENHEDCRDHR